MFSTTLFRPEGYVERGKSIQGIKGKKENEAEHHDDA